MSSRVCHISATFLRFFAFFSLNTTHWQCGGQEFKSPKLHQTRESINPDQHVGVVVCDNFGDLKLKNNYFEILNPEKYLPLKVVQPSEKRKIIEKGSVVKKHE